MFAKLSDGVLTIAPKKLAGDGTVVYNPPADMYLEYGWKPVQFTNYPDAPEGYCYKNGWEEQDDAIVQIWTLTPLPDDIDEFEAWEIIFGGDGE